MIVKIDVVVDQFFGLIEGDSLVPVYALCFENGKEILGHGIVIAVSPS